MSSSPRTETVAPKKVAAKAAGSETTKRVAPQRVKGWTAFTASAYGGVPGTRSLSLNPVTPAALKKRTEGDEEGGELITVSKPITVLVTGTAKREEDGKVYFLADADGVANQREIEDLFVASCLPLLTTPEGKTSYATYYGDNYIRLKDRHFQGRYVTKFKNGERDASINADECFSGKRCQVVLKYYGAFQTADIYGALLSVAAFNLLE